MTRRRLKLLPEILPAPPPPGGQGDPRERTLKRLGRLLTAATAAAAVSNCGHNGDGSGYAVVDPMPPPPQCDGLAQSIHAEARFISPTVLLVTLGPASMRAAAYQPDALQIDGFRVLRQKIEPNGVELEIEVTNGPKYVAFQVGATCPNGPESVGVSVQPAKEGQVVAPGVPIHVTLTDSYPIERALPVSADGGSDAEPGEFATPPPGSQ